MMKCPRCNRLFFDTGVIVDEYDKVYNGKVCTNCGYVEVYEEVDE